MTALFIILQAGMAAFATGNNADVNNYIMQYRSIAVREMIQYGIPASITLAQGILESGSGKSELAVKANNHFGIKCQNDWQGRTVYYDDDAANECFRSYNSAQESFHDHSVFLTTRNRYAALFELDPSDYKGWAKGLKKAGYATNPKYAELLIQLIEDYDLHEYDKMTLADLHTMEQSDGEFQTNAKEATQDAADAVFYFNRIPTVLVKAGDTPESIALAHNLFVKRILVYNDIQIDTKLEPGTHIYLQPKRKKGKEKYHTVQANETMWSISRDAGVDLERLYKYNLMQMGEEPAAGEILYLRKQRKTKVQLQKSPSVAPAATGENQEELPLNAPASDEMEFEKFNSPPAVKDSIEGNGAAGSEQPVPSEEIIHTVQPKETLYSISKTYGVTIEDIATWNALQGDVISVGQQLIVGYK